MAGWLSLMTCLFICHLLQLRVYQQFFMINHSQTSSTTHHQLSINHFYYQLLTISGYGSAPQRGAHHQAQRLGAI